MWEHFDHESDIGIRGIGSTLSEAFVQIAYALTSIVTELSLVQPIKEFTIFCSNEDPEMLLIDWLNEIIYLMSTQKVLFCEYHIELKSHTLIAILRGEKVDKQRHQPAVEPKGATYSELKVAEIEKNKWIAQCIIDI